MIEQGENQRRASSTKFAMVIAIIGLAVVVVAIMVFSTITGSRIAEHYAPLVDASLKIRLEATVAHLWLEEVISGDRHEDITAVWEHLDQSAWYAHAMLEGGENAEGEFSALQDLEIRREIVEVVESISSFRAIAEDRWSAAKQSGIGSDIDQRFDAVFQDFLNQANEVEVALKAVMAKDLRRFRAMQALSIAACVLLIVLIGIVFQHFERRRTHDLQAIQESQRYLKSIVENEPECVKLVRADGVLLDMNPAGLAMIAAESKEQVVGNSVYDLIAEEDRERYRHFNEGVCGGQRGSAEFVMLDLNGERHFMETTSTPLDFGSGDETVQLGITRDITVRKQAEEERRQLLLDTGKRIKELRCMYGVAESIRKRQTLKEVFQDVVQLIPEGWFHPEIARARIHFDGQMYVLAPFEQTEWQQIADITIAGERCGAVEVFYLQECPELDEGPFLKEERDLIDSIAKTLSETIERQQAETLESQSRQKFALHVERTPLGVIEWNTDFEVVEWNPGATRIFGFTRDEAIGRDAVGLVVPESARDHVNRIWSDLLTHRGGLRSSNENLTKTGETIVCEWYNTPLVNADGDVLGVTSLIQDVTERHRSDAERERLMLAIEQANETVVITDAEGTIQYANPAFERITGYSLKEAIGQNPNLLKSGKHDDAFFKDMWDTLTHGETWTGELINKKKDGTLFTETATISPVRDATGATVNYVAVKRDITEELKLTNQLRQAQRMEAVGNLAGGMAHDFNNLLQVIGGFTEFALNELGSDSVPRSALEQVREAADRATDLTRQLLAFSRRQVLQPVDLDLSDLVANLMKMLGRLIGEHIELDLIPGHRLGNIFADRGQIEQVLMNLCVNARDAMPNGGKLSIETENVVINADYCRDHPWAIEGKYVLLSVNDTGCGMDQETKDQIFEPFFTTKEVGKGTGLGLATVYGIVKQHNGMVYVYSEIGKGTTFKVYLPIVAQAATAIGDKIKGPLPTGTETILIAEDEEMVLRLARLILERAGYTVLTARDGEEALQVFENHEEDISLTLLDVVMPKMSGHEVQQRIFDRNPSARILFTSGYSGNGVHTNFILQDGFQLIQKPYDREKFLREVRKAIDK